MCDFKNIIREKNPIFGFEQTAGVRSCQFKYYTTIKTYCMWCYEKMECKSCLEHTNNKHPTRNEMWHNTCPCDKGNLSIIVPRL